MGVDFQVNVNVKTNGKEAVDALERQLAKLQNESVNIKVNTNGLSGSDVNKQFEQAGKQASSSFNKGMSSRKIGTPFDYATIKKANQKEIDSIAKEMRKSMPGLDTKTSDKWATEYVSKRQRAYDADVKAAQTAANKRAKLESDTEQRWQKNLYNQRQKEANEQKKAYAQKQKTTQQIKDSYWKQYFQNQNKRDPAFDDMKSYYLQQEKEFKELNNLDEKFKASQKQLSKYTSDSFGDSLKQKYGNTDSYARIIENLEKAKSLQASLGSEMSKGITSSNFDGVNADLKEMNSLVQKVTTEFNRLEQPISTLSATKAGDATLNWLKNNSKAAKEYGSALESLAQKQKQAKTYGEANSYAQEVNAIKARAAAEGKTGNSPFSDLKRAAGQIAQFAGVYGMIQNLAFQIPKDMIQAVKDINSAQIELSKVSDAPTNQLTAYWNEAADSAKKYGATISDVINSTADWSRLGYNLDEAKKLSDATTLMQKVGDNMTQESSSQGIISTLKGFQFDASEVTRIIDEVNEVANTQPIDTTGIFAGLERSASSMSAANNTLEQTIALITAANSVVQDPASVGTAFKTLSMRIRGAETELEEAGLDTDGMAESTAKLREEILALSGVDIMKDENSFKGTYDILDELSTKWQSLTDIQQASITELIAGKRQGNIMSALMSNFDIARETLNTALNDSSGSAEKELSNYQKGIQYSLDNMKASFQSFSTSAISSDLFKGIVDTGAGALDIITQLIDRFGILATTIGGFAIGKGISSFIKNFDQPTTTGCHGFPIFPCGSIMGEKVS